MPPLPTRFLGAITRDRRQLDEIFAALFYLRRRRPGPSGREHRARYRNYRDFCNRKVECPQGRVTSGFECRARLAERLVG
jgi:hypothetical protein